MTSSILKFLSFFKPIFVSQGIDFDQMRAIVGIKLEMDNRRVMSHRYQQTQEANSSFTWTFAVYFILGGFLSLIFLFVPSVLFVYTVYHSYLMVMLTLTLISDFSAILLDTSDNTIVLPKPISNKTFYAARTTHILIYIGLIGLALAILPMIVTFFKYGFVVGLALLMTTVLTIVFSVALTNGLYLLLMRFTSEERLKNIINYFQIGMAIFMMGGYQILPRFFSEDIVQNLETATPWWSLFIPPMWMATTIQIIHDWSINWISITNVILAIGMPIVLWKAINQFLTPLFTQKLADLGTSSSKSAKAVQEIDFKNARGHYVASNDLQRATFNLASFGFARDRKLKLRMYPAFGYFLVMIFVFVFRGKSDDITWLEYIQQVSDTQLHLTVIYTCIYVIIAASFEIHFTDDFKAAWVFQISPIAKPGELLIGTIKSIFIRFLLPMYIAASAIILSIWGIKVLDDIVLGFLICVLLMLILGLIGDKHLPLSMPSTSRTQGSGMARALLTMIALVVIGIGHYFLGKIDWLPWAMCPIIFSACWFSIKQYQKVTWEDIGI